MSSIGKIFAIINLALAAAFLGWAANLHMEGKKLAAELSDEKAARASEKAALDQEIDGLKVQLDQVNNDLTSAGAARDALKGEKADLETKYGETQNNLRNLQGTYTQLKESVASLASQLENIEKSKDRAVQEMHAAEKARDEALSDKQKADLARRDAEQAKTRAEDRVADLEVALNDSKKQNGKLSTDIAALVDATGVSLNEISAVPQIEAMVLQAGSGIVTLNVGSAQKVLRGMTFHVYRGSEYLGQVRVEDVQDKVCAAVPAASASTSIRQGDRATTRL
jgi:predicted  nucleic acid-binding Zn-ribbon protein